VLLLCRHTVGTRRLLHCVTPKEDLDLSRFREEIEAECKYREPTPKRKRLGVDEAQQLINQGEV
jgi:hypothetical protein